MDRNQKAIYYGLIFKKGILILPRFFLTLLLTAVVLIIGTVAVYTVTQNRRALNPKIHVAVVVPGEDVATQMATQMIGEMESVKSICDFSFLSAEEADAAMHNGSIQAAIYLTENIYDDIYHATNTPVRIQVAKSSGLGVQRFKDLVNVGLSMLQVGEATVYSLLDISKDYEMQVSPYDLTDTIAMSFVDLAMNRNNIWNTTFLSPYGNISMMGFYSVTAALAVVCLLFGAGFAGLYDKKERAVDICLRRMGIGSVTRSLARLLIMTVVNWFLLLIVLVPALYITKSAEITGKLVLLLVVALWPLAFSVAAFIHLVNAFAVGESGSLFYLIISILLFVLGGGLFPAAFLPSALYRLSSFLPIGFWQKYLADLLWNGFQGASLRTILIYGAGMAVLGGIGLKLNENK